MNPWISAAIAAVAGLVVGLVLSRVVRRALQRQKHEALVAAAAPIASLVYAAAFITGLMVALGFVQPESLEEIPADLVDYLPRALAAVIVLIGGNIVGTLARTATQRALEGGGSAARYGPPAVRMVVLAAAAILAAAQLGVDTTIINIASAALLFGLAATMALLTGLGGRQVAAEIAAGRAWRNVLNPGDRVATKLDGEVTIDGTVVSLHATAVEVDCDGRKILVPNSQLLDAVVERSSPDE